MKYTNGHSKKELSARLKRILKLRSKGKSLAEIGLLEDITRQRVHQILSTLIENK